ncbi:MAG: twin-arginine translocation signal domain-containing protein [Polyangiaceae bacterium]|jgi:hypothetical protein
MHAEQKRRDFLKTAAVASAMGVTATKADKVFAQTTGSGVAWTPGMQINPAIENTRVICCHDTNMLTQTPPNTSWPNQNAYVNAALVSSNLDEMAMQLTQQATATSAWSTIFRSSKAWASTKVAIKTNGISGLSGNHPRVAIIKKICDVFVDQLGVPAANIVLYDATDDASIVYTSTYASLTDSTKMRCVVSVLAGSLGGYTPVTIANSVASAGSVQCVADLANGVIDILVNVSVCKVHNGPGNTYGLGSVTMCLKNHLGTFNNAPGHAEPMHALAAIMEVNQHEAILGGTPVRQQLCIVDALLCNSQSPGGSWDSRADRIVMGTFAPMVDYTAGINIVQNVIRAGSPVTNLAQNVPTFLTSFGYTTSDPQYIEYIPGQGVVDAGGGGSASSSGAGSSSSGAGSSSSGAGSSSSGAGSSSTGGGTTASSSGGMGKTGSSGGGAASSTGGGGVASSTGGGGSATGSSGGATSSGGGGLAASSSGGVVASSSGNSGAAGSSGTTSGGSNAAGEAPNGGESGGGCDVAGSKGRGTPWGAMAAVGAAVAGALSRRSPRSAEEEEEGGSEPSSRGKPARKESGKGDGSAR